MAKDDPKSGQQDTGEAGSKPGRRSPPTLDLSARDVTPVSDDAATAEPLPPETAKAEGDKPEGEVPVFDVDGPPEGIRPDEVGAPRPASEATSDTPPPSGPRPARQLGLFSGLIVALVAGVLGGAVALAVVSTFYSAEDSIDSITELEARAVDLRQRVEALEARGGDAPAVDTAAPTELAARLDALESGLDALGKKVDGLPAAAPAGGDAPGVPAGVSAQDLAALTSRVGALENKGAATPDEVAAVKGQVAALDQRVAALPAPAPAASPAELDAANARIGALESRLAATAAAQRASGQGAAQLVALSALREAVASGRPFALELKASMALLADEGAPLAALEPAAAEGFAAGPALAIRLRTASAPAPAETPPAAVPADEGVVARLLHSAQNLVTVRRSDEAVASTGLSRAEAALERGDVDAAQAALAALPEAERAVAQPVLAILDARQAALATVADLDRRVLATLAGGAQ